MKKILAVLLVVMSMSCQPVWARETEAQFDDRMARLEDGIRRWHPEVIWVDVQDLQTITLQ